MSARIAAFAGALALAGLVGVSIVSLRTRTVEAPEGAAPRSAASVSKSGVSAGSGSVERGQPASLPESEARKAASHGQDVVMCRSLVQTWIDFIERGNAPAADRAKKAVLAYGPVARETIEWAIATLNLRTTTADTLRGAYAELR